MRVGLAWELGQVSGYEALGVHLLAGLACLQQSAWQPRKVIRPRINKMVV